MTDYYGRGFPSRSRSMHVEARLDPPEENLEFECACGDYHTVEDDDVSIIGRDEYVCDEVVKTMIDDGEVALYSEIKGCRVRVVDIGEAVGWSGENEP